MYKKLAILGGAIILSLTVAKARADELNFLSTQLRPLEEAQKARTQTLECIESGLILSVSYNKVEELYVQNPAFGFYFLRLASARLFQNIGTLEQRLAQASATAPEPA